MCKINQLWRFFGTFFCFLSFGIGGLFLTFFFFPALNYLIHDTEKRKHIAQITIRQAFRFFVSMMTCLGTMSVKVEGRDILEEDKGCLIVANHPTLIDYVLITSLLPKCDCIVKHAMWKNPFARGAITAAGYIDNSDTSEMLLKCRNILKKGNVLLIFPEGTRTIPGEDLKLKRGAANIAIRTHSDLRIVQICCTQHVLNKYEKWYHTPKQKPLFLIRALEKIKIEMFIDGAPSDAIAARRLTDYLEKALVPETI